jgi:hypothetical protein
MMEDYKISSVDRWFILYTDKNVEFKIGEEAAWGPMKDDKNNELLGAMIHENSIEVIRGKLSVERIEIERIKDWLLTVGGYKKIIEPNYVIDLEKHDNELW